MSNLIELLEQLTNLVITRKTTAVVKPLAAAGDYTAEDVLSESATVGTAWAFSNMGKANGGQIIKAIALCSTTALTPRLTLYLFNQTPTCVLNDNVANTAVVVNDSSIYQGRIDFPAMEDLGTGQSGTVATISTYGNLPLPYIPNPQGQLYGVLVTRDNITGEAVGMSLVIILMTEQYK